MEEAVPGYRFRVPGRNGRRSGPIRAHPCASVVETGWRTGWVDGRRGGCRFRGGGTVFGYGCSVLGARSRNGVASLAHPWRRADAGQLLGRPEGDQNSRSSGILFRADSCGFVAICIYPGSAPASLLRALCVSVVGRLSCPPPLLALRERKLRAPSHELRATWPEPCEHEHEHEHEDEDEAGRRSSASPTHPHTHTPTHPHSALTDVPARGCRCGGRRGACRGRSGGGRAGRGLWR